VVWELSKQMALTTLAVVEQQAVEEVLSLVDFLYMAVVVAVEVDILQFQIMEVQVETLYTGEVEEVAVLVLQGQEELVALVR
jgi:hypothetical protein